ncbi:MAG: hypothetical protein ACYSWU_00905 [Planctomycetota bacterium]|jgi:hypothetical protein
MNLELSTLRAGQWVRVGGEAIGYIEKVDRNEGTYEVRLLSQWDASAPLPSRDLGDFIEVVDLHGYEEEARKQADKLWYLLRTR